MAPREKAAQLPESPGVYLFKDAGGTVLYVGKARNLRSRVRSYFLESRWIDAKTGSLAREIADLETIVVGNEREALALEHNLIKQYRPKFNVVLRDDKTYPYIKFTAAEKYPRVYFTRRVKKDGSLYFGPYFPSSLARRILHFVHKRFLVPSCTVDLRRSHPRPCLQYYIKRCLGPCVAGLTTDERYAEAARDVRLFLDGRRHDLIKSLEQRMAVAAEKELFEQAAAYRDLLRTLEDIEERQRIAAAQGDDTDVLAYYAEPPLVAADLFHLRGGRVVDRREFYWEELEEFDPQEFVPSLLKQLYLEAEYLPKAIHVSADFEDRELLEVTLTERAGHNVEIFTPQRETFVRTAIPGFDPDVESDWRSASECAQPGGRAEAHRELRHFSYARNGHRGVYGRLGKRAHEEIGLPQVHHSWRRGTQRKCSVAERRLCQHA